jgi:hypothetical protein
MTQNQTPVFVVLIASILFSVGLLYLLISNYSDQQVNVLCGDVLLNDKSISSLRVDINNVEGRNTTYVFFRILVDDRNNAKPNKTVSLNGYKALFDKIRKIPKKILLATDAVDEDAADATTLTVCINKPRGIKQNELTYQMVTFYPGQSLFRVSKNIANIELIRDKQWVYFDLSDDVKEELKRITESFS